MGKLEKRRFCHAALPFEHPFDRIASASLGWDQCVMLHSKLMRYIDEVARLRSIRKAAERMNVASSAISRQIIAFEKQLGLPIFERLPKGVRLTTPGELLIEHIRGTLKDYDRTMNRIGDFRTLGRTRIVIATLEALMADVVAPVVSDFQRKYPLAKIIVWAMPPDSIVNAVIGGEAQLGLGFDLPAEPNVRVYSTVKCSLGIVVRPDHPLASRTSVRLHDCLEYPLVLAAESLTIRTMFDRVATKRDAVSPIIETNSIEFLKRLPMLSEVVTVLTRTDVEHDRRRGTLAFVPFSESDFGHQALSIVHRTSAPLDPATLRFVEMLAELTSQIGDPSP